ncbi:VWA domain-containing protein [Hydrogenophaga sp. 5NK40-0174]|uniref:nitric oxide reductase activation protein NorD n=1 Tax=Hydrogenophaga sp. 5NK40-0174 TaxID=3127649 RepID=UPI00310589BC
MEEWVGFQWHRFIDKVARRDHPEAEVCLGDVQRSIGMLFRAGGGAHGVRVAPGSERTHRSHRRWLERVAGRVDRAATARLEPDVLSLPAQLSVFTERSLNRSLYLWLAAMAAVHDNSGDWVADNVRATQSVLAMFPGLRGQYQELRQAHLALRPDPSKLSRQQASAELTVQEALRTGVAPVGAGSVNAEDVAPVWLWLESSEAAHPGMAFGQPRGGEGEQGTSETNPSQGDGKRRRARRVKDERDKAPLMMFFRAESILSWGEFVKVNRASDEDPNDNASQVANDMDELSVASGDATTAGSVRFDLDLPSAAADDLPLGPGQRFPEWNWKQGRLLPDHCAIQELRSLPSEPFNPSLALRTTARRVRRRMEVLRAAPQWLRHQADGDELDLDAVVHHEVARMGGEVVTASPSVYRRQSKEQRDLATLLLADLSLSTDAYASQTQRVIDVIRDGLYVFGESLHAAGDPFSVLGFSSVRRQNVRVHRIKGFDDRWDSATRDRVGAIKPGYYTRMGAAIRFASAQLSKRPERQKLLLVLTDGKPNDLDVYEGRYGLEDTRHAILEARTQGLTPFCITIDETANDYLPMLFGHNGYALVRQPQDLAQRLTQAYLQLRRQT